MGLLFSPHHALPPGWQPNVVIDCPPDLIERGLYLEEAVPVPGALDVEGTSQDSLVDVEFDTIRVPPVFVADAPGGLTVSLAHIERFDLLMR